MKKLLSILVLSLLWCNVGIAAVIKLECNPVPYGDYKKAIKNYQTPNFFKVTLDTKLKTLVYNGQYPGQQEFTVNEKVLSIDDRYVVFLNPEGVKSRFDYISYKEVQLGPPYAEGWDMRCTHSPDSEIAEKPKKQKPKKKTPDPDDNKIVAAGSGSGFIVSKDGTVITNYHVIEGCELNKVTYKGSQLEAKVLSIDKVNDIAILKTNINSDTAFAVSNEDVSLLEDVVVAGFPLGKQISSAIKTHKGVVTALAGAGDNYSFFQTDAAINQGNSGGPIINQKGNVIGIAVQTWVEEGVQGVHFGIKSSTLKTFASANGLKFLAPNNRDLSNKELGKLITENTVYVECHMTIAKIKKMIAEAENKKAFFKDYQ